jgi:hypothetical protein
MQRLRVHDSKSEPAGGIRDGGTGIACAWVLLGTSLTKERIDAAPMHVEREWKQMASTIWLRDLATYHTVEPCLLRAAPASSPRAEQKP